MKDATGKNPAGHSSDNHLAMKNREGRARIVITVSLLVLSFAAIGAQQPQPVLRAPRAVLFIGDSFTYAQDGIYTHLVRLAASARPPLVITADKSVFGGAFLHRLWDRQEPLRMIRSDAHDVVVLQEDIPETTVADFREYARMFVTEVRKTRARPILFMAWPYKRLGWISMEEIAQAHRDAARELNVEVAPVGLAWQAASRQRPDLNLYDADEEHPSIFGTYLATCVIYVTIYDRNPAGLSYAPAGVTREDAAFLQRIAWETAQGIGR